MDSSTGLRGPAGFATQANALLRKNLCFQKRNLKTNACISLFPILVCVLLLLLQGAIDRRTNTSKYRCGCACVDTATDGSCRRTECGAQHSTLDQVTYCEILSPPRWPALIQVPRSQSRAVRTASQPFNRLPEPTCRVTRSCPAAFLVTGSNRSLTESLSGELFPALSSPLNFTDYLNTLSNIVPGSDTRTSHIQLLEPTFISQDTLYILQLQCQSNLSQTVSVNSGMIPLRLNVDCIQALLLWRKSASVINEELFNGYRQRGSGGGNTNEFVAGYDFLNTNKNRLDIIIWFNSTYNTKIAYSRIALLRVPRLINMASNAYIKFLKGSGAKMLLEYVKDMPKVGSKLKIDIGSILSTLLFTWIVELIFPVMLTYLVYEKQQKLKIMMKMHGLKDGPYWLINYAYFFSLSVVYIIMLVIFGSLIGLRFFTTNDYGIQFVFYLIHIKMQTALAFFTSSFFSSVEIATVVGYGYVFGSGLLGGFLLHFFIQDASFPKGCMVLMQIIPGFSLYRGLYEFSAFSGNEMGTRGMKWHNLRDPINGMCTTLIIMVIEWAILLPLGFYLDNVSLLDGRLRKRILVFFKCFGTRTVSFRRYSFGRLGSNVLAEMENSDATQERELVEHLMLEPNSNYAIICDNLKKVYHGMDGNADKLAVRGLSLAIPKGKCFGMLGPNGAGKTSFISMMIGLIPPTSGTAYVHGLDIRTDMNAIYTNMGVCPQHDLLWERLTGKEHLLFYGRLKNLKGAELLKATDYSLKSVNLFDGGVGDKQVRNYSGGMKRRLSVAISLIGDPKVVFMDEPSTGLDPASRNKLWSVVKEAKKHRAIILTTHSMEEAEILCDRLGIFVNGGFECIANPKELKTRYEGTYIFTMTTSLEHEHEIAQLVLRLSPSAKRIYHISGTQKFELPKQEVKIADVFHEVERAKCRFNIHAWGLTDTTLEDVFIKVAKGA
ncbi:ABC transporter A family member 7-like [Triticum dicoccoides]|uniref:ABC transporter A family member 7-like n=1 Tax=Triticum dicoccoides TaxID=85692 RepID=UPI00188E7151|nr:ABC transporter A family member 7-like [Triticum dicoccoides]